MRSRLKYSATRRIVNRTGRRRPAVGPLEFKKPKGDYVPPKITLYIPPNRRSYCISFIHPVFGKRLNRSLAMRDETEAKGIALDLERLVKHPEWWSENCPVVYTLNDKATEIFFGKELPRPSGDVPLSGSYIVNGLSFDSVHSEELVMARVELAGEKREKNKLKAQLEATEAWARELSRKAGHHVKATLEEAVEEWKIIYPTGRNRHTVKNASTYVDDFTSTVGGSKNLVTVRHGNIDGWLAQFRNMKTGGTPSPATLRKARAYLSSFITWAYRHYDLPENPMLKTGKVPGLDRNPEHIKTIRNPEDLKKLISSLEPWPYWQAWVAVACLAGLRWSEQAWLKVSDVHFDQGYLRVASRASGKRVTGTKTGKERTVPIEKTVLKDVLQKYLKQRNKTYPWLFPTKMNVAKRRFTEPGQWTGSKAFKECIKKYINKAKAKAKGKEEFWTFGPREWRHIFGTACGHSGHNSLEISRWMGNSPDVAERHYIAQLPPSRRWPYKWI